MPLLNLRLVTNYDCGNRCVHCYENSFRSDMKKSESNMVMSLNFATDVLLAMSKSGLKTCSIIGGEPARYPFLLPVISLANDLEFKIDMATNGRRLKDKNFLNALIERGLNKFLVTILGSRAEVHDQITRVSGSFDETIAGIKNLVEAGVELHVNSVISKENKNEVISLALLLSEMGVKRMNFSSCVPPLLETGSLDKAHSLSPEEYVKIMSSAFEFLRKEKINCTFNSSFPICLFEHLILKRMIDEGYIFPRKSCDIYSGSTIIFEPNGNIIPCNAYSGNPLINTRNEKGRYIYRKQDIKEIWEGPDFISFRRNFAFYPSIKCDQCIFKEACMGGCPFFLKAFNLASKIKPVL